MGDATKNFSYSEFRSRDGTNRIKFKVIELVQKIRDYINRPIHINSGYRSWADHERVYKALGKPPVKNSAHLTGEAADIWAEGMTKRQLGAAIKEMRAKGLIPELEYCYLIAEGNRAVHVGVDKKPRKNVFGF